MLAAFDLGVIAVSWPNTWCYTISYSSYCVPSDGMVPLSRQEYPGGTNVGLIGPSHVEETGDIRVITAVAERLQAIRQ